MKELVAIRLVNWYHFERVTLRLAGSCQLLGDNSSGKSTILDAVQFALVADMKQVRFNKAANDQSSRSLAGYVRYKLGSEDERVAPTKDDQRPQRFVRGSCTSYVMLQFADSADSDDGFICGSVLEASDTESTHVDHGEFIISQAAYPNIDDVPAISANDFVSPAREFRALLRSRPGVYVAPSVKEYQEELRHRLGALPQAFHHLIVKALGFRPIGQVKQFVMDYLLDAKDIDTSSLQANLENYKRLEAEARMAEERLKNLAQILALGEQIFQERRTAASLRYVALRAIIEQRREDVSSESSDLEKAQQDHANAETEIRRLTPREVQLSEDVGRLQSTIAQNATANQIRELEQKIRQRKEDLEQAQEAARDAQRILGAQVEIINQLDSSAVQDLRRAYLSALPKDAILGVSPMPDSLARLRKAVEQGEHPASRDLNVWQALCDQIDEEARSVMERLKIEIDTLKAEGKELEAELKDLDRGQNKYPNEVEALLHLLHSKLRGRREPKPLCELIEVKNQRWTDAIEGVLGAHRHNILVAPEDFARALSLYEKNKQGYYLPDAKRDIFLGGVGLVDMERVLKRSPRADRGSLAEQVDSEDALARSYVDFTIGDVACCDSEQDLRKHNRAVTDTAMVYQGYVARQIPREVYRRHYIGAAARIRRREEIVRRLDELRNTLLDRAASHALLTKIVARMTEARVDLRSLRAQLDEAQSIPNLKGDVDSLEKQLASISRREIQKLETELQQTKEELKELQKNLQASKVKLGVTEARIKEKEKAREKAQSGFADAQNQLHEKLGDLLIEHGVAFQERFERERGRPLIELITNFEKQANGYDTRVNNLYKQWAVAKQDYINKYGLAASATAHDAAEFVAERELWAESKLPEYQERIAAAKEQAIQQLAEDIIFKLRANLVDVRRQIDELNRALKDVPFGNDRYEFRIDVNTTHREFYDLIMEAGHFQKDSLFGNAALGSLETKQTLRGLFDSLIKGEAKEVKTELEKRADYREYFKYDLRISHKDGTYSSYDRVAGDKSGGETQTPYYIAIFASMYRLYRTQSMNKRPTCGVLLLDESFSKMDEGRIAATLSFARELKLQLVLATPKERAAQVAPLVETCLYVHKDPDSGEPTVLHFSKKEIQDFVAGSGGVNSAAVA